MKKLLALVVTLLLVFTLICSTSNSVSADYCDEDQVDPRTGIVCP